MARKAFIIISLFLIVTGIQAENIPFEKIGNHPRILASPKDFREIHKQISSDSIWGIINSRTLTACNSLLSKPCLGKKLIGIRMLSVSREGLYRIFMLSYAYRLTGNKTYAKRAEKEMLQFARFDNWNPTHFLDVAEMVMAMAIGYDWTYNTLTPQSRSIISDAILNKGLKPSLDNRYNGFLLKTNNWQQVCNTALAYGAIAIMDKQPELCKKIILRSIEKIKIPMHNYSPDGGYPEGYGYWQYGTTYNVMMLAELQYLFGTDFGLSEVPGFLETGYFIKNMVGPSDLPFNFGDSSDLLRSNTSLFWFAKIKNDNSLIQNDVKLLLDTKSYNYNEYWRLLPSIFIFGKGINIEKKTKPGNLKYMARGKVPVCLMRTSWTKDALYCAVKGGSPSDNTHTHMDDGIFILEGLGVRWAIDLGPQDYNSVEQKGFSIWDTSQNSDRWKIYRNKNISHNVISIDDSLFKTNGHSFIIGTFSDQYGETVVLDNTSLYHDIKSYQRRITMSHNCFAIKDSLVGGSKQHLITWRMLTKAHPSKTKEGLLLTVGNKAMSISFPPEVNVFIEKTTPNDQFDSPNDGVSVIGYRLLLPPGKSKNITVKLTPYSVTSK